MAKHTCLCCDYSDQFPCVSMIAIVSTVMGMRDIGLTNPHRQQPKGAR